VITVKPNAVAVSGLCLLIAAAASAQTAAPAKPAEEKPKPADAKPAPPAAKPATAPVEAAASEGPVVTIAAERPSNRIDRQAYDVKADVGATNNSAADALNNVPSVTVDPDGTVSLRGNTNVPSSTASHRPCCKARTGARRSIRCPRRTSSRLK
jgi:hypothetical protein